MGVLRLHRRPPPKLPIEVFGPKWRQWIMMAAEAAACPPDYVEAPLPTFISVASKAAVSVICDSGY